MLFSSFAQLCTSRFERYAYLNLKFNYIFCVSLLQGGSERVGSGVTYFVRFFHGKCFIHDRAQFVIKCQRSLSGVGCRPLFGGRFPGSDHAGSEPFPARGQVLQTLHALSAKERRLSAHGLHFQAEAGQGLVAVLCQKQQRGDGADGKLV